MSYHSTPVDPDSVSVLGPTRCSGVHCSLPLWSTSNISFLIIKRRPPAAAQLFTGNDKCTDIWTRGQTIFGWRTEGRTAGDRTGMALQIDMCRFASLRSSSGCTRPWVCGDGGATRGCDRATGTRPDHSRTGREGGERQRPPTMSIDAQNCTEQLKPRRRVRSFHHDDRNSPPPTVAPDTPSPLREPTNGRSRCENASVPSRVSLSTLTFNPARAGAAPVHHYHNNTRGSDAHPGGRISAPAGRTQDHPSLEFSYTGRRLLETPPPSAPP